MLRLVLAVRRRQRRCDVGRYDKVGSTPGKTHPLMHPFESEACQRTSTARSFFRDFEGIARNDRECNSLTVIA